MGIANSQVVRFTPRGITDSFDATDRFAGACRQLTNLIFDQSNPELVVTRPGVTELVNLADHGFGAGFISIHIAVGTRIYGMIASTFAGKDVPFCWDLATGALVAISGATALNTPDSPEVADSDWTPPTMAVVGVKILLTHPGYSNLPKWLWGTTVLGGSNQTWGSVLVLDSAAANADLTFTAVSPIPGVITVAMHNEGGTKTLQVSVSGLAISVRLATTAGVITSTANDVKAAIDGGSAAGLTTVAVQGTGAGVVDAFELPQAFNGRRWGDRYNFGYIDLIDPDAPTFDASTTFPNTLTGPSLCVVNFSNRAYYAVGNIVFYSDVLDPLAITNADQQVTVGDSQDIMAMSGLPVQTTGSGMLQTMTILKDTQVWQLAGDAATWNLSLSYTSLNVGTNAPRTLTQSPYGLYFSTTGGIYFLDLLGTLRPVTHSQGDLEPDVQSPFANAVNPSRWCAAYNSHVYRVAGKGLFRGVYVFGDYWFDEQRRRWNGPHAFPYDCASAVDGYFVLSTWTRPGLLIRSNPSQNTSFVDTDLGTLFNCNLISATLPKLEWVAMKQVVESTLELAASDGDIAYLVYAQDEFGRNLGRVVVNVHSGGSPWGSFIWADGTAWGTSNIWGKGSAWGPIQRVWGGTDRYLEFNAYWSSGPGSGLRWGTGAQNPPGTYPLEWSAPLVFEKIQLRVDCVASGEVGIGTLYLKAQKTGYMTFGPRIVP